MDKQIRKKILAMILTMAIVSVLIPALTLPAGAEGLPTVTLSVDNASISENGGSATVTATLSTASASSVTVTLGYTGTAAGGGTDYTAPSATITIAAGNTSGTATVTAAEDLLDETDETVIVGITGVTEGAEIGTPSTVTITITDNDFPNITISDASVAEGNSGTSMLTFTVNLSAPSSKTVTANYATEDVTATAGTDYTAASGTLTFSPGETSKTVNVTVFGDTVRENTEHLYLNLTSVPNANIVDGQGIGTITNDDAVPEISVNDVSVTEGNSGTKTLTFTVTLNHASALGVSVQYATANNTATAGTDYTAASGTLNFSAEETSKTVGVTILGDSDYEPDESFFLNLTSPSGATISDNKGVGTITNDDVPSVTLSVSNTSIVENGGSATVTATISAALASTVTVTLAYTGTATGSGTDYTASSATITIAAGDTSGTATITAVDDALDETNETVTVDITGVENCAESGTQQITVTITDDDDAPSVSVNDASVTEGNSGTATLTFTVTLSAASGKTVTVDYATAGGTATAGTDYTAASGTLTFAAGETSKTVSVVVLGDTVTEPNETLLLNLSNPTDASLSGNQGSGTITDDDAIIDDAISSKTIIVTETSSKLFENSDGKIMAEANVQNAFSNSVEIKVTDTEESASNFSLGIGNTVYPFDISLYLMGTNTKTEPKDGYAVTISLPIPDGLLDVKDQLSVMHKSGDGTVATLASQNKQINGVWYLVFKSTEFSPYALVVSYTGTYDETAGLPYYVDGNDTDVFVGFAANGKYLAPDGMTVLLKENPKNFSDTGSHWAENYINFVTERELFNGTGNNRFSPNTGMTRAMFATVIGRLYERSYGDIALAEEHAFTDCDYSDYYGKYVDWAFENGIVGGTGGGLFEPDMEITREEAAVILYRFADFLNVLPYGMDTELTCPDSGNISSWAENAALYCQSTGIITGRHGGNFVPQGTATRAEVAVILERFVEYIV